MDYTFYVIIRNSDGKFYKKYSTATQKRDQDINPDKSNKCFTDRIGEARIFTSENLAKAALPVFTVREWNNDYTALGIKSEVNWLDTNQVSIIKMRAV